MRDYLRTFSLCFEFWKNYRSTEPFPGIGFQTTNERRSPDDLPRSEVKQSNPISAHYRPDRAKHKRSFHGISRRIFCRLRSAAVVPVKGQTPETCAVRQLPI